MVRMLCYDGVGFHCQSIGRTGGGRVAVLVYIWLDGEASMGRGQSYFWEFKQLAVATRSGQRERFVRFILIGMEGRRVLCGRDQLSKGVLVRRGDI
jgi:hypothetical protein